MTLEELFKLALDARLLDLHVAIPGKVESYSGSTCKASVRPMIKRAVPTKTGGRRLYNLPVIQNVRIAYAGGKGLAIAYPLEAGDTGTLVFCEVPIAAWGRTGEISDPEDLRRHTLSGGVFFPGLYTDSNKPTIATDGITLGKKDGSFVLKIKDNVVEIGGSSDAAALASKVDDALTDIALAFNTFVPGSGGASFTDPYLFGGSTASDVLKLGS